MSTLLRLQHNRKTASKASILIDKIDRSQGNFTGYAYRGKQKVYVPYTNPKDANVAGYIDLVPTDEVMLSWENGTIKKLTEAQYLLRGPVLASSIKAPTVASASLALGTVTVSGTTFVSIAPDVTYVMLTNLSGVSQMVPAGVLTISGTQITFLASVSTIGAITSGWKVAVKANSKVSNTVTIP